MKARWYLTPFPHQHAHRVRATHARVFTSRHVLGLPQKVPPVVSGDFTGTISPALQMLALGLVDVVELFGLGAEGVRGAEDVRDVVVEAQLVVDDTVVDVVRLEQVLERPRAFLRPFLDIVHFDLGQTYAAGEKTDAGQEAGEPG
nr:hypothetical protein CFP56_10055 [Quercus suber]